MFAFIVVNILRTMNLVVSLIHLGQEIELLICVKLQFSLHYIIGWLKLLHAQKMVIILLIWDYEKQFHQNTYNISW